MFKLHQILPHSRPYSGNALFLTVVLKLGLDSALIPETPKVEPEQPVSSICQKDLGAFTAVSAHLWHCRQVFCAV